MQARSVRPTMYNHLSSFLSISLGVPPLSLVFLHLLFFFEIPLFFSRKGAHKQPLKTLNQPTKRRTELINLLCHAMPRWHFQ